MSSSSLDARRTTHAVSSDWTMCGSWAITASRLPPPHGEPVARPEVVSCQRNIASAVERCEAIAQHVAGVIVEDKRWSLSVHFRLADPAVVPTLSSQVAVVARELGLRLTYGRRVFELRPPVNVDKGTAALDLVRKRLGALAPGAADSIIPVPAMTAPTRTRSARSETIVRSRSRFALAVSQALNRNRPRSFPCQTSKRCASCSRQSSRDASLQFASAGSSSMARAHAPSPASRA